MNCKELRKYAGAFADGELEVAHNLEALEHLNMCPRCAERVTGITNLKVALQRAYETGPAPQTLLASVLAAVRSENDSTVPQPATGDGWQATVLHWGTSLGLAAAVVLAVYMIWFTRDARLPSGFLTVAASQPIEDVRDQHLACAVLGRRHHNASLTRDLSQIRVHLGEELKLAVLAPNLEAEGFHLLGADRCGVRGRPGAHLLYRCADTSELLSVFTIARWERLEAAVDASTSACLTEGRTPASSEHEIQVVAWSDGACTHAICGPFRRGKLIEIATLARSVSAGFEIGPTSHRLALSTW